MAECIVFVSPCLLLLFGRLCCVGWPCVMLLVGRVYFVGWPCELFLVFHV